jgi:NodT family efflux transporter outer membrane factor (OMF) lipoprotein
MRVIVLSRTESPAVTRRSAPLHTSIVAIIGVPALCACVTHTAPMVAVPAVDVPAGWAAAQPTGNARAEWWWQFDDPMLGTLVERALEANTSVGTARAALLQARAFRDSAAAGLWPTVDASASAQRGTSGGHSTGSRYAAGVDASWAPDIFGAARNALAASDAAVSASAARLGDVQVAIAAELGLDYILLRSAQARHAIAAENLASQQETLQITRWREQAGLVSSLETQQAIAAVEQTRAALPALQTAIDQASHALAVLVGQPPGALLLQLSATVAVPRVSGTLAMSIPAETLRQRADVRAAEYDVAAAQSRVAQADAERWPGFSLGGSLGLSALGSDALTRSDSVVSTLLASVRLPLFDAGARRANVRAEQAALAQAQQAYRATVLGALRDVEDALVALRDDRLRLASLVTAADAATSAALLARQRNGSGLVDFQTVLQAERTQFGAQDSVASGNAAVSSDHVRLFLALGGGWHDDTGVAADSRATAPAANNLASTTPASEPTSPP